MLFSLVMKTLGRKRRSNFTRIGQKNYDEDVAILDFRAPRLAAESIASCFGGDKGNALVLDVACGTGLVAAEMKKIGFQYFIGVDGSDAMLDVAKTGGLYQELKMSFIGTEELPVQLEAYDIVMIVGALSVGHVPVNAILALWKAAKPGGYICMTTRTNKDNLEYKTNLDQICDAMETEGKWKQVGIKQVADWEKGVTDQETGYISGVVYIYKKSESKSIQ